MSTPDEIIPALEAARDEYLSKLRLTEELVKAGKETRDQSMVKAAQDRRRRARLAFELVTAKWQLKESRTLPDRYRNLPTLTDRNL